MAKQIESAAKWTQDSATAAARELIAQGIQDVRVRVSDYATPENTVAQRYWVEAVIRDPKHGNTVLRSYGTPADLVAPSKAAKALRAEVKARAWIAFIESKGVV